MFTVQGRNLCVRNTSKADKIETQFIAQTQSSLEQQLVSNLGAQQQSTQRLFTHMLQQADKDPEFRVEHRLCSITL